MRTDRLFQKRGMCAVGAHIDFHRKDESVRLRTDRRFQKRGMCAVGAHIDFFRKMEVCGGLGPLMAAETIAAPSELQ